MHKRMQKSWPISNKKSLIQILFAWSNHKNSNKNSSCFFDCTGVLGVDVEYTKQKYIIYF